MPLLLFNLQLYSMEVRLVNGRDAISLLVNFIGHGLLYYLDQELEAKRLAKTTVKKRQLLYLIIAMILISIERMGVSARDQPLLISQEFRRQIRDYSQEVLTHYLLLLGRSFGMELLKDDGTLFLSSNLRETVLESIGGKLSLK